MTRSIHLTLGLFLLSLGGFACGDDAGNNSPDAQGVTDAANAPDAADPPDATAPASDAGVDAQQTPDAMATDASIPTPDAAIDPCGNGLIDGVEVCDDGNQVAGDGCSDTCTVEAGATCNGSPSACYFTPGSAGDLVITEIMKNSSAVSDSSGEWFELHNPTIKTFNISGVEFKDDGTNSFTVATDVFIAPGAYIVLGRNADTATNGGLTLAYEFDGMTLSNGSDEVEIVSGGTTIDRVAYTDAAFPDATGVALSLSVASTSAVDNDIGANWCDAAYVYGAGDSGTPGLRNPSCTPVLTPDSTVLAILDDDVTGITSAVDVSAAGCVITSVEVDISISHTAVGDLVVELQSPLGTTVRLRDQTGFGADDINGTFPTTLVVDGPGALSDFAGEIADGTWSLKVSDLLPVDVGTLNSFTVRPTCSTSTTSAPAAPIPDNVNPGVIDTVAHAADCSIASVTVDLDVTHTFVGDLIIRLRSPDGTSVFLHNASGGGDENIVGNYPNDFVEDGPGDLTDFVGQNAAGDWTLFVNDEAPADTGTLNSWGLNIRCNQSAAGPTFTPVAIPDDNVVGISDTRLLSQSCVLLGVNLEVDITHTWIGDLVVELVSPTGTVVRVHDNSGGSAQDIKGTYPYTLSADGNLDAFLGEQAMGAWTLRVADTVVASLGSLDGWRLKLDCP